MINNSVPSENRPIPLTRRMFLGAMGMLSAGMSSQAMAAMATSPLDAKPTVPTLTIDDPTSFRILQVTDLHLFHGISLEHSKIDAIAAMVRHFKPDIIVNTGDLWASKSGTGWLDTCQRACRVFAELKTPWAFAWGNHDEAVDYNRIHALLEKSPCLLYCGAADGNYRIEVRAKNNTAPIWNLIVLNDSRGGFQPEQINWFKAESERIRKTEPVPPAFLFFHIPLPQYGDIANARKAFGVKFEAVCHENGSREAFTAFRDAGFVQATFCGHDHTNDYYGVLDGIRLQYGRALGGYGEDKVPKGGTLITVNTIKKSFDIRSVFADGTSTTFDTFKT